MKISTIKKTKNMKTEDQSMLTIMHYSQLLNVLTGFGGFLVPFIIWIVKRDEVVDLDAHGKAIINFQASMFLWGLISVPLIFALGLGFLILGVVSILMIVYPIINGLRASEGKPISYPLTINFLK